MAFGVSHTAYVLPEGRGYGRYAYTWSCTCGSRGGYHDRRVNAEKSARQHEKRGR